MLPVKPSMIISLEIIIEYVLTTIVPRFMEIITKQDLVGLKHKGLMAHILEETKITIITPETTILVIITIMALARVVMARVGQESAIKN